MKKSFMLHIDSLCILDELTDEQKGQLFYAIYKYQTGEEVELSPIIKIAFSQFKNQFIRDNEKYKNTCEARKLAGSKGGKQRVANQANATNCNQNQANQADSNNKKDSKKDSNSNKKSNNNFINPTIEEVISYSIEYSNKTNLQRIQEHNWYEYYSSRNWKLSNGKDIKDWKATIRTWYGKQPKIKKQVKRYV